MKSLFRLVAVIAALSIVSAQAELQCFEFGDWQGIPDVTGTHTYSINEGARTAHGSMVLFQDQKGKVIGSTYTEGTFVDLGVAFASTGSLVGKVQKVGNTFQLLATTVADRTYRQNDQIIGFTQVKAKNVLYWDPAERHFIQTANGSEKGVINGQKVKGKIQNHVAHIRPDQHIDQSWTMCLDIPQAQPVTNAKIILANGREIPFSCADTLGASVRTFKLVGIGANNSSNKLRFGTDLPASGFVYTWGKVLGQNIAIGDIP